MPDPYYKPVGHKDYGKMGPFNKKNKRGKAFQGAFGTGFQTSRPKVNDVQKVKAKKRG